MAKTTVKEEGSFTLLKPQSLATTEEMYPDFKTSASQPHFLFNLMGVNPLFLKHQYSTDIIDNAQLILICGTVGAVHVHEGLVSLRHHD